MLSMDRLVCKQLVNDISVMLFHDDHSFDLLTISLVELVGSLLNNLNVRLNLLFVDVSQFLERVVGTLGCVRHVCSKSILDIHGPIDLVECEEDLTNIGIDAGRHLVFVGRSTALVIDVALGVKREFTLQRRLGSISETLHPGLDVGSELELSCLRVLNA